MSYLRKDQKENVTVGQTKTTIFICISVMPDNSKAVIIAIKHGMGAGAGGNSRCNFLKTYCAKGYITLTFHSNIQGGSNMTGTDFYVNKPHCAAAVRP